MLFTELPEVIQTLTDQIWDRQSIGAFSLTLSALGAVLGLFYGISTQVDGHVRRKALHLALKKKNAVDFHALWARLTIFAPVAELCTQFRTNALNFRLIFLA